MGNETTHVGGRGSYAAINVYVNQCRDNCIHVKWCNITDNNSQVYDDVK